MMIRLATHLDADEGSGVLRLSITELCHPDHEGDPEKIAAWLANKSPEAWRTWIVRAGSSLFVAEESDRILGVGMIDHQAEILLNYVLPEARWQGVSKSLLVHMEEQALRSGFRSCHLTSTKTALAFYKAAGYRIDSGDDGEDVRMSKKLAT